MVRHFNITPIKSSKYQRIVFSLTTERLDNYIYELEEELKKEEIVGNILMDLIISNGVKHRRYALLYFDGNNINLDSFKIIDTIEMSIEKVSNIFYYKNIKLIENSVLTRPQKFLFRKKLEKMNY